MKKNWPGVDGRLPLRSPLMCGDGSSSKNAHTTVSCALISFYTRMFTDYRLILQYQLIHLKYFSITYKQPLKTYYKNDLLLLLRRMINLEEMDLEFLNYSSSIIDGNTLTEYFINLIPRLQKVTFNIGSLILLDNPHNLPSNEDIKNTFKNLNDTIVSNVYYFSRDKLLYCHVYSYPYRSTFYRSITNDFPGELFKCVREISLRDERPFEHDFFLRIAQSFPFIKKLILYNKEPQQNNYLMEINLKHAHKDYVDQFLNEKKTCLLYNVNLLFNK
jgi:hypothetical protein